MRRHAGGGLGRVGWGRGGGSETVQEVPVKLHKLKGLSLSPGPITNCNLD